MNAITQIEPALARYLVPVGRALFAAIFLIGAPGHFAQATIGYAAQQGVPFAQWLVPFTGLLMLAGGVSVLLGYRARLGAWALVVFLVPVTVMMHNFWAVEDPMMAQMQQAMFWKNVAMVGGLLLLAYFGAGPVSLDARRARRLEAPDAAAHVTRDWPAQKPTTADTR